MPKRIIVSFRPRVALLLQLGTSFERRLMQGLASTARERGWELAADAWGDVSAPGLRRGYFDGVIASIPDPDVKQRLRELEMPVVNVGRFFPPLVFPRVASDDEAIGRMVAEHLLERNFWHFGFVGCTPVNASLDRRRGFAERLGNLGQDLPYLDTPTDWSGTYEGERQRLEQWLLGLERPVGIFVSDDILARRVVQCAQQLGLRIPHECAVVGVGDYELLNEMAPVSLTSVVQAAERIGQAAAEILDKMMNGQEVPVEMVRFPPIGIVTRQSSDTTAVANEQLASALEFIRLHLADTLSVSDVAAGLSVSRRWLEVKFREHLDRSPRQMIRQFQMDRARRLLVETDWPISLVARRCGLRSPERLSTIFRQAHGMPPRDYRNSFRGLADR